MLASIVQNQTPALLGIMGSDIWSGQNVQQFNSLAISWSMASDIFSIGGKYQWVTIAYLIGFVVPLPCYLLYKFWKPYEIFKMVNLSIIGWYMGFLFVGVNSSLSSYYLIGFVFQYLLRKYRPQFFIKYNYILSAALDGGTQILVFILTFAVNGGSGTTHPFP
jgi:hypothetical protein